jgi:MFS family permease
MTAIQRTQFRSRLPARLPFFYGWVMLGIGLVGIVATSPGQTFTVSVFNPSFREALNLSHTQLTGAYLWGTLIASLPQPYIGTLMDRFGIRRAMFGIVILFTLACLFIAQVQSLVMLFFAFLMIRMFGQGALSLASNNTIAMWFQKKLGTVSGVISIGSAAAFAFIPRMVLAAIEQNGWRTTYMLLGGIVFIVMMVLIVLFFYNKPADVGQFLDGVSAKQEEDEAQEKALRSTDLPSFTLKEAKQTKSYWIALFATAAWSMIVTAILFNLFPLFEASGLSAQDAAATTTFFGIALAVSQLFGGMLADRIRLRYLAVGSVGFLIVGLLALLNLSSTAVGTVYAICFGVGQGLLGALGSTIWVRYYGRDHIGKIRGSISRFTNASSSAGPFIMGFTFDQFGSYQASLTIFIAVLAPLLIAAFWIRPPEKEGEKVNK